MSDFYKEARLSDYVLQLDSGFGKHVNTYEMREIKYSNRLLHPHLYVHPSDDSSHCVIPVDGFMRAKKNQKKINASYNFQSMDDVLNVFRDVIHACLALIDLKLVHLSLNYTGSVLIVDGVAKVANLGCLCDAKDSFSSIYNHIIRDHQSRQYPALFHSLCSCISLFKDILHAFLICRKLKKESKVRTKYYHRFDGNPSFLDEKEHVLFNEVYRYVKMLEVVCDRHELSWEDLKLFIEHYRKLEIIPIQVNGDISRIRFG